MVLPGSHPSKKCCREQRRMLRVPWAWPAPNRPWGGFCSTGAAGELKATGAAFGVTGEIETSNAPTRVQEQGWVLLPLCPLSGYPSVHWCDQETLSTGRFLVHRRVGCGAHPEVRTGCLCERCSVHVFPHLTREGLMSAREERVLGIPDRLGAVRVDACTLLPPALKSQGGGFWHQGL